MSTANGFRLLLLGPPGAGKGTQAERLAAKLGLPHISTGEILRAEVAKGSPLGERARGAMERGELVTDDLMLDIVQARLHADDCTGGFILDGFPRSLGQAVGFEETCGFKAKSLKVLSLEVPPDELVSRMSQRGRQDDREDVIRQRLTVYRNETAPLREFYRERDALVEINGLGSMEDVFGRLLAHLGRSE